MVVREVFGLGMPIPVGAKPVQKITKWERVSCLLSQCSGVFMGNITHCQHKQTFCRNSLHFIGTRQILI